MFLFVRRKQPKNNYTKKTNKLVLFSILRHNLTKFVTQMGLYCSKQLETTFNQFGKKSLHITFKTSSKISQQYINAKAFYDYFQF